MPKIFEKIDKALPAFEWIYKFFVFLCKLLLIADILIACYGVFARYIKVLPPATWGEEIILTLMSYMVVFSAALAIRRNAHIRMSAFDSYLPPVLIKLLDLLADICVIVLAWVMLTVGMQYALTIGSKGTYATVPGLSRFWKYFPVPVAGVAMLIFELEATYKHIKAFWVKEEKK